MKLPEDNSYRATLEKYYSVADACYYFRAVAYRQLRKNHKEMPIKSKVTTHKWTKSKISSEYHQAMEIALQLARDLKYENDNIVASLMPTEKEDIYFENLCDKWYDAEISPNRYGTRYENRLILNEIKGYFGPAHIYTKDLRKEYIRGFHNHLLDKNKSIDRISRIMKVVLRILKFAVSQNYIESFDFSDFSKDKFLKKAPANQKRHKKEMTWEQAKIFENKIRGTSLEAIGILRLHTGMRVEEACGLPWRCVDLNKDIIKIEQVMTEYDVLRLEKNKAKSENSYEREIPIDPDLHKYLSDLKEEQERNKALFKEKYMNPYDEDLVIRLKNGKIRRPKSYSKTYRRIVDNDPDLMKLPYNTFYDIRHTFANHAVDIGVSLRTLAQILGDNINTVEQYYLRKQDREASNKEYNAKYLQSSQN